MLCNAFTACPKTASNPWAPYWNTREIHRLEVRATPAFPRSQSYLRQHFGLRGCSWNTDLRHWCRLLLRYHRGLLRHSGEAGLGSDHSDLRQSWRRGVTYHPGGRCLGPRLCLWTLGCGNQRPKLWHGRGWYQKNTIEKIKARSVQMRNITEKTRNTHTWCMRQKKGSIPLAGFCWLWPSTRYSLANYRHWWWWNRRCWQCWCCWCHRSHWSWWHAGVTKAQLTGLWCAAGECFHRTLLATWLLQRNQAKHEGLYKNWLWLLLSEAFKWIYTVTNDALVQNPEVTDEWWPAFLTCSHTWAGQCGCSCSQGEGHLSSDKHSKDSDIHIG